MGVLNVTPDSFSDGGSFFDAQSAVRHGLEMAADGADIIDVGGESTRPGAEDISIEEECSRVIPVIKSLAKKTDIPISIDTRKSQVADSAVKAGARIINDVSGLRFENKIARVAAKYGSALIIMHSTGTPKNMQADPRYVNLVKEVIASLKGSVEIAKNSGVSEDRIIVDPGIGFGKTVAHNLEILNRLDEFKILGRPICIGTSRKSFIGKVMGAPDPADRLSGTIATCVIAIMKGARILRVHDVKAVKEAARMADSIARPKDN